MSHVDSVLLPESDDPFVIWLGAKDGDFNITIIASYSKTLIAGISALFIACLALVF